MEEALLGEIVKPRACKDVLRIIVSLFVMAMLLWIVQKGYRLTTNATRDGEIQGYADSYIALVFGVATLVSGLVYFIIGLTVVAELAVEFVAWMRSRDKRLKHNQEKEEMRGWHVNVMIRASATTISILMLTWATYHGYKLSADGTPNGRVHIWLAFLIGFITMAFGIIYFIIGISIVAESALYLSGKFQYSVIESGSFNKGTKTDALLAV